MLSGNGRLELPTPLGLYEFPAGGELLSVGIPKESEMSPVVADGAAIAYRTRSMAEANRRLIFLAIGSQLTTRVETTTSCSLAEGTGPSLRGSAGGIADPASSWLRKSGAGPILGETALFLRESLAENLDLTPWVQDPKLTRHQRQPTFPKLRGLAYFVAPIYRERETRCLLRGRRLAPHRPGVPAVGAQIPQNLEHFLLRLAAVALGGNCDFPGPGSGTRVKYDAR